MDFPKNNSGKILASGYIKGGGLTYVNVWVRGFYFPAHHFPAILNESDRNMNGTNIAALRNSYSLFVALFQ